MIHAYGSTKQGSDHVERNTVCQDAHYYKIVNDHFAIGAVADGLGSELYTDRASKIASKTVVDYCLEKIDENEAGLITVVLKEAFCEALKAVNDCAMSDGNSADEYDTTLVAVVYLNGKIYWGNAGDSGIIVYRRNGMVEAVTYQQRDLDGCVFPLVFGEDKWEFGQMDDIAAVLLATDGMYETFFPGLLRNEEINIYVALAMFFMDYECLGYGKFSDSEVAEKKDKFIENIPKQQVRDDKTVLVFIDDKVKVDKQNPEYYATPNWEELKKKRQDEYKRLAYPELYKNN